MSTESNQPDGILDPIEKTAFKIRNEVGEAITCKVFESTNIRIQSWWIGLSAKLDFIFHIAERAIRQLSEQPEPSPDLKIIIDDLAYKISDSVRVTGEPNMETCEDLESAFAYWEKDSLHKIIRKTIGKAIAAKEKEFAGFTAAACIDCKRTFVYLSSCESMLQCPSCAWSPVAAERDALRTERNEYKKALENIQLMPGLTSVMSLAHAMKRIAREAIHSAESNKQQENAKEESDQ